MGRIIRPNPKKIIPWHQATPREGIVDDYRKQSYVPRIPLVKAPEDLSHVGEFVLYNGHHRRASVIQARAKPYCYLMESNRDLINLFLNPPKYNNEIYPELIDDLPLSFEAHRDHVWNEARRYHKLLSRITA